ncbi:hypothetical protein QVD17_01029 [Tagetes erecta]|uniref:Uncharacterized protein n=1 Tax=Tagetes erecta TaxID=13708 RepID=A0AAD8L692_TARER|nr:hypothetical protein QVD17_01029 [Tagetes erecta]
MDVCLFFRLVCYISSVCQNLFNNSNLLFMLSRRLLFDSIDVALFLHFVFIDFYSIQLMWPYFRLLFSSYFYSIQL